MSRKTKPKVKSLGWTDNCIFCGKPADSEEDAFPTWLIKWLKENVPPPDEPMILERQSNVGSEVTAYDYDGDFKAGVMCVCKNCNCGWMSRIQNEHGRPILLDLMTLCPTGSNARTPCPSYPLDTQKCLSLTHWGIMTAMVLDHVNNEPEYRQFNEVERCEFWKSRKPPANTFMWVAEWHNLHAISYTTHLLIGADGSLNGLICTLAFHKVAMQIVRAINGRLPPLRPLHGPHNWDQALLQVFPIPASPVVFPPPVAIDRDPGIEYLELRFSPPGADSGSAAAEEALWKSRSRRRDQTQATEETGMTEETGT